MIVNLRPIKMYNRLMMREHLNYLLFAYYHFMPRDISIDLGIPMDVSLLTLLYNYF